MKSMIVVILALVAVAVALPVEEPFKILRSNFEQQPEGSYTFAFETENKITREEVGERKSVVDEENKTHEFIVVRGSYSYLNEDGSPVTINFVADENGFQPVGEVIPKPARR